MNDAVSPPPRRSRRRTLLRYAAIILLVVGAGLFLARRQIGNMLARELDARLSAAGVFVTWGSADWVPGPGIRLHDLALFRDAAKQDRLALFENLTAIKGQRGWNRWETVVAKIADSRLTLGGGADETKLEHLEMRLLIEPGKAGLQEFHANLQGLRIEASGAYERATAAPPGPKAEAAANPTPANKGLLADVNFEGLQAVKEWVKVQSEKDDPVLKVEFHSLPDGSGMDLAATLDGRAFQWRGQKWDLVQAAVRTSVGDKPSPIKIERVRVGHAGRTGEVSASFDPARGVVRIGRVDSGIDLLVLARALAPKALDSLAALRTTGEWRISGEGEVPVDHPENSRWDGTVALNGNLEYVDGGTRVALQQPAFALQVSEQTVSITGFKAGVWDGNLEIPATKIHFPTAEKSSRFETQVTLSRARLQSVMKSFGTEQGQPGVVQASWKGGGGFELGSITGSGALSIHEAEFYRIPLLGPLHVVFDKLTPGFARDVASTLTTTHRISGGALQIQNLKVDSKLTRIEGNGSIDLNRQYADFTAKAKLQGIAGLATGLLSALLEVQGEGPVSDVHWKLKNVPGAKAIGEAAGLVGKTGGAVIEGAGDAVKGAGKAAKGLLKIPGKLLPGNK
jgi:hypothetical protein